MLFAGFNKEEPLRVTFVATMLAIAALFWMDAPVRAEGNLASRPERLETLLLGADLSFSAMPKVAKPMIPAAVRAAAAPRVNLLFMSGLREGY